MENEINENSLFSKLKFWFLFNCTIFTAIFLYQSYFVIFKNHMLVYKVPKLYSDTDFLLEEFWSTHDIVLRNNECMPILKTTK